MNNRERKSTAQMRMLLQTREEMKMAFPARKIVTSHVYPPIPVRNFDWCAYFDDEGAEAGNYGYGRTEAEAAADLIENYGDEDDEPAPRRMDNWSLGDWHAAAQRRAL